MGQKCHPYGFRVVHTKNWKSKWFSKREYASLLHEDLKLRRELKLQLHGLNAMDKNPSVDPDGLVVRTAFVDEGFRMKRVRPAPMGRAYRTQKRTCHITLQLAEAAVAGEE